MRSTTRRVLIAVAAITTALIVTSPAWAAFPDQGNRIPYVRGPAQATATRGTPAPDVDMFSIRNNGADRLRLTDTPNLVEWGGFYSPGGSRIVYMAQSEGSYRIARRNADGSGRVFLTDNQISIAPNWSRNGKRIVYLRYPASAAPRAGGPLAPDRRGLGATLMVMNADGSEKEPLLTGPFVNAGWSPTDPEIAFTAFESGEGSIYTVPAGGGKPAYFCCKGGSAIFADWSPNGNRILFLYQPPLAGPAVDTWAVISVRRNGSDQIVVTEQSAEATVPRFSDDGDRVIFAKEVPAGNLDLFSVLSDGTGGSKRLTDTPRDEFLTYLLG